MVHLACSYWKSLILSDDVLRVTILKQTPLSRSSTVDCNNEAVEQIPLGMITMRKSIPGFPFLSYMSMGMRLAALRSFGAPLLVVQRLESFAMEYPTSLLCFLAIQRRHRIGLLWDLKSPKVTLSRLKWP